MQSYDLMIGTQRKPKQPSGLGWRSYFFKIESRHMEELWGGIESRLPLAYEAAASSDAPQDPDVLATFREATALHFVRNPALAQNHDLSWLGVEADSRRRLRMTVLANPTYPMAGVAAGLSRQRWESLHKDGVLFRLGAERHLDIWKDKLAKAAIEFVRPDSEQEFLIGDVPVIAYREVDGTASPARDIGAAPVDSLLFPVASDLLLRFQLKRRGRSFSSLAAKEQVAEFNKAQVMAAKRGLACPSPEAMASVYYRPGAGFGKEIPTWLEDVGEP